MQRATKIKKLIYASDTAICCIVTDPVMLLFNSYLVMTVLCGAERFKDMWHHRNQTCSYAVIFRVDS